MKLLDDWDRASVRLVYAHRVSVFDGTIMKLVLLCAIFALAGCSGRITAGAIAEALKVCSTNEGLLDLEVYASSVNSVDVRCNNGVSKHFYLPNK